MTKTGMNYPSFPLILLPHRAALFLMAARVKLMKSFDQTFSKVCAGRGREALVGSAEPKLLIRCFNLRSKYVLLLQQFCQKERKGFSHIMSRVVRAIRSVAPTTAQPYRRRAGACSCRNTHKERGDPRSLQFVFGWFGVAATGVCIFGA